MNIAALRAVPRRAWWTLAGATLVVCAFAFDRDLGVTVVIASLAYQFLANWLELSSDRASRLSRTSGDMADLAPDTADFLFPSVELRTQGDGDWVNPATGSFINEHSGVDNRGCSYGQSDHSRMDHRW
jgi:hypothetical protein